MAAVIAELEGNASRVAHVLCLSRRQLYRYLWRWDLWPEVDAARQAALDSFNARRAKLVRGKVVH